SFRGDTDQSRPDYCWSNTCVCGHQKSPADVIRTEYSEKRQRNRTSGSVGGEQSLLREDGSFFSLGKTARESVDPLDNDTRGRTATCELSGTSQPPHDPGSAALDS